jgi:hypothetical protein
MMSLSSVDSPYLDVREHSVSEAQNRRSINCARISPTINDLIGLQGAGSVAYRWMVGTVCCISPDSRQSAVYAIRINCMYDVAVLMLHSECSSGVCDWVVGYSPCLSGRT